MLSCSEDNFIPTNEINENLELQIDADIDDNDLLYYTETGKSDIKFKMQTSKVENDTGAAYRVDAYGRFIDENEILNLIHMMFLLDENGGLIGSKATVTDNEEVSEFVLQDNGKSIPQIFKGFVLIQTQGSSFSGAKTELEIELNTQGIASSFYVFKDEGIQEYWGLIKKEK